MIDTTTPVGRAVAATFRLAEKQPWSTITLLDVADEAGLTLVELSRHVSSKASILRKFVRLVDDEVLRRAERREPGESLRERLFDVLMTRLEAMAPYKAGLKRIAAEPALGPELVGSLLRSQGWMLTAAGIPSEGVSGMVRTTGLASVYAATFRDWLDDDDAGLAKTMAALDRRLRRGEGWMRTFTSVEAGVQGFARRAGEMMNAGGRRGPGSARPAGAAASEPATGAETSSAATTASGAAAPGEPVSPAANQESARPENGGDKPGGPSSALH